MIDVSIVIPVYNALAAAKECVRSIFAAGSTLAFEVIVMDNGSAPDVEAWLREEERTQANLRHLRDAQPLGFAIAVNRGAAAATGRILIVLNSDTLVSPGWLEGLAATLDADPSLGAITPCTNQAGEPAQMDLNTVELSATAARAVRAKHPATPDVFYLPQRLTFFAVALRREVWLAMNGLAECYPVGNYEDDDLCLRLRTAGYRLGVAKHVFVYHHNNATFEANRIDHARRMTANAAVFAGRARDLALAIDPPAPRWPHRPAGDISVVIHGRPGGSLEHTLRSLRNQTVHGFEIVEPGSKAAPSRAWVAHVSEGDVLYPFHLETLLDALSRHGAEAVCADVWAGPRNEAAVHPDAGQQGAPQVLAGWMHHSSLDPERIREQTTPLHWPRLTWEMAAEVETRPLPTPPKPGLVDALRNVYRRTVTLETRLALDGAVRKALGLKLVVDDPLRELTVHLEKQIIDAVAVSGDRAPVVQFNAVAWHSATQRQHHFARGLARRGHPVLWVETDLRSPRSWYTGQPSQQVAANIHLVRLPGLGRDIYHLPWSDSAVAAMSAALRLAVPGKDVIALVNYPRWQPLVADLHRQAGWRVVYDCLDDQRALADIYGTTATRHEDNLIAISELLFTSSVVLQKRLPRPATLLHNGADFALFSSATSAGKLAHLPRPVIGFFGALADWLDMDLIHAAALRYPHYSFVYIGPPIFSNTEIEARWTRCTDLPNITCLPQMDPRTLAAHLAEFDVCTMPFLDLPVTRTMNAVKLYEYLAAGKPTISRLLTEVGYLAESAAGLIALYDTPAGFYAALEAALAENTAELVARRQEFAGRHDWNQRLDILAAALQGISSSSASSSGSKTLSQE